MEKCIVNNGELATERGWVLARTPDDGEVYFLVERWAAENPCVLAEAAAAAAQLEGNNDEIRRAVLAGIRESA